LFDLIFLFFLHLSTPITQFELQVEETFDGQTWIFFVSLNFVSFSTFVKKFKVQNIDNEICASSASTPREIKIK
jgi:ribosomal protein L10